MSRISTSRNPFLKLRDINRKLLFLIIAISAISIMMLYSAGRTPCPADAQCLNSFGGWHPWASSQLSKILLGFVIMFVVAVVDMRIWVGTSYWIYGAALITLVLVSVVGQVGMGAQRWLALGPIRFQPSEFMKIGLVLALAKYFSSIGVNEIRSTRFLVAPGLMTLVPVLLVAAQPDLGTAMSLLFIAVLMFFVVGIQHWKFGIVFAIALVALPIVWKYGLHDYQRARIQIFLNPEEDTMGTGYHITQSKITIGSGGFIGKGFLRGTQSHLNFLPEKQTDFIFTMFAEEFGMLGALILFVIVGSILWQCYRISLSSRSNFGRLLTFGIAANFFVYFFINTAMVMGLLPVVGVPSPLLSYGGTSVLILMFGFGLAQCCAVHRDELISSKNSYL